MCKVLYLGHLKYKNNEVDSIFKVFLLRREGKTSAKKGNKQFTVIQCWHGGRIYTIEIGKGYKSELPPLSQSQGLNI